MTSALPAHAGAADKATSPKNTVLAIRVRLEICIINIASRWFLFVPGWPAVTAAILCSAPGAATNL